MSIIDDIQESIIKLRTEGRDPCALHVSQYTIRLVRGEVGFCYPRGFGTRAGDELLGLPVHIDETMTGRSWVVVS